MASSPENSHDESMLGTRLTNAANERLVEELTGISVLEELPDVYVNDQEITTVIAYALA